MDDFLRVVIGIWCLILSFALIFTGYTLRNPKIETVGECYDCLVQLEITLEGHEMFAIFCGAITLFIMGVVIIYGDD